jgi:hypothetical protein
MVYCYVFIWGPYIIYAWFFFVHMYMHACCACMTVIRLIVNLLGQEFYLKRRGPNWEPCSP